MNRPVGGAAILFTKRPEGARAWLMWIWQSWIGIGLLVGTYLNWKFVAERLRTYTERAGNAITLSDYFESRFEDRSKILRMVSAIVIIVFFVIYVSSGLVAGGLLFELVFGIDQT